MPASAGMTIKQRFAKNKSGFSCPLLCVLCGEALFEMTEKIDCAVIGAGVVGLAIARELAHAGREVVILEAENAIGTHTSSRNSEVIHAGIYYPKGSLKARSCVEGRHLLYEYCASHGVPHRRCGKLIVATTEN